MVTIRIPAPSSVLVANVLGALGLILAVVAVGGLAGLWWAALAGGVSLITLSVIALTWAAPAEAAKAPATVTTVPRSA